MDITYYRQREQAERAFAKQAVSEAARASHLDLAERYRELIEAYERLTPAEERGAAAPDVQPTTRGFAASLPTC